MIRNGVLSRHFRLFHREDSPIKEILLMKKKEILSQLQKFRREGIYKFNKLQAANENPVYQREKKANKWKILTCCGFCNSFISKRGFFKHTKICQKK